MMPMCGVNAYESPMNCLTAAYTGTVFQCAGGASGRLYALMPGACKISCCTECKCACHMAGEKQKCVQSQHVW